MGEKQVIIKQGGWVQNVQTKGWTQVPQEVTATGKTYNNAGWFVIIGNTEFFVAWKDVKRD